MEIPSQLQSIIATLSPEESAEMNQFLDGLPSSDIELNTLISENLEPLVQALTEDYADTLVHGLG
ncbi:MAG: hypothetical protein AAFU78_05215 [Cyanobacteria bacterium J06633_2]